MTLNTGTASSGHSWIIWAFPPRRAVRNSRLRIPLATDCSARLSVHHGDVPLVTIEGEPTARQFNVDSGRREELQPQFQTAPARLPNAGAGRCRSSSRLRATGRKCARRCARTQDPEYEPIRQNGLPAFLEWGELLSEAGQQQPAAAVSPQQQVLVADLANQFFTDLFASIDREVSLRKKDDEKIILFNRIVDYARQGGEAAIQFACRKAGLRARSIQRVLRTIGLYRQKIQSEEFTGAAVRAAIGRFCFNRVVAVRIVIYRRVAIARLSRQRRRAL